MKYLHVLTPYTIKPQNIVSFIENNFVVNEHIFLILADEKYVLKNNPQLVAYDNVIYLPFVNNKMISRLRRSLFIKRLFAKANYIIWHSYFGAKGIQLLTINYIYRKKITWIEHGLDLYHWQYNPQGIKNRIAYYLCAKIRKECQYWGITLDQDKEILDKQFHVNKETFFLPTPFNLKAVNFLKKYLNTYNNNKEVKSILVGIDGLKINKHREIFNKLSKYKGEKFSCFVPMNYSLPYEYGFINSKKYSIEVIEYANRILEVPVINLNKSAVDEDKYFQMLNFIDIAIFNFQRPVYLDMLYYLLYMGKKVYLPSNSLIYKSLINKGIRVFDIDNIDTESFEEFMFDGGTEKNKDIVDSILDEKYIKQYWNKFFLER